jgi:dienelactone hydrolase
VNFVVRSRGTLFLIPLIEVIPMSIQTQNFSCKTWGDQTLRGIEFRPEGDNLPIAIVSHGFLANLSTTKGYAQQLAQWGYAAYCFDFCGGCVKGSSDGSLVNMTVFTEVEDLKAVLAYVKSLPYVDPSRIVLMGCSQGGFVSALTAAQLQEEISQLVLFYPALCIPDDARSGKMMFFQFDPTNIPQDMHWGPLTLGGNYAKTVIDTDPFAAIAPYQGPVLIVHGTADKIVKLPYAQRAWEAYEATRPDRCQLITLEGATHGFDRKADEDALPLVREFLQGRSNVLTIRVQQSNFSMEMNGLSTTVTLNRSGTGDSPFFTGVIQPGGVTQRQYRLTKRMRTSSDYTLKGTDRTGTPCSIHIVKTNEGDGWNLNVTTDSKTLSFLNGADCTIHFEEHKSDMVARLFAAVPSQETH